jgi:hypothetical protein
MVKDLIKFDKSTIVLNLVYDFKIREKFELGFNYLAKKLKPKNIKDLSTMKWYEGKNYDWIALKQDGLILLLRKYQSHFTIYVKNTTEIETKSNRKREVTKYGCFIFSTDTDMLSDKESEERCENRFIDINKHIKGLADFILSSHTHSLWNNASYKREDYIKIETVWNGGEDIVSLDNFIFALEELSSKFLEVFSENDMLERIKTIQVGDSSVGYKVLEVFTEVENDYYHGVGLKVEGHYFMDVYFLTNWCLDKLFTEKELEDFEDALN